MNFIRDLGKRGGFQFGFLILLVAVQNEALVLSVNPQVQEQSTWCWVVTDKMVSDYKGGVAGSQCDIAKARLGKECCGNASSCLNWNTPDPSRWVSGYSKTNNYLTPAQIKNTIDNNYPFQFSWWIYGANHFMVGRGYDYDGAVIYYNTSVDQNFWGMWYSSYVTYNYNEQPAACVNWRKP